MAHATDTHEHHETHAAPAEPESRVEAVVAFLLTVAFTALLLWTLLPTR